MKDEQHTYPHIFRRYLSSLIDLLLFIGMFFMLASIIPNSFQYASSLKTMPVVIFIFFYEPILTSKLCTFGQFVTGIRVINCKTNGRISIVQAYIRYVLKYFLGWLSFLTVLFSARKRAIHDIAVDSVVVSHSNSL